MTDHKHDDYDGIVENDNPLPKWWLFTFYGAVVFAVFYVGYYWFGNGPTLKEEYAKDYASIEAVWMANKSAQFEFSQEKLVSAKPKLSSGKAVYQAKCVSCHGAQGEGGIGPNLTDEYWIHSDGKPAGLANTIYNGVLDKGMPAWGAMLTEEELYTVLAYVVSLRGTNPANAKPPQGNKYQ
ncbi:MAG: c-type cytochrome [Bacteriovoracia bacterium]